MDETGFISAWINTLYTEPIKSFPSEFASAGECKNYELPGKGLLIGKEFFGEYELLNADGSEVFRVENYENAKFFIYANRNKPKLVSIPTDGSTIKNMNIKYEKYLDSIIKRIDKDYSQKFPGSKNLNQIINKIFNHLNLIRLK